MNEIIINLLKVTFATEEAKEIFMDEVESEDQVFSFDCVGIDSPLDSVSFKPVGEDFLFLFITEDEDVKGELLVLSEAYPDVSFNYLIIAPGSMESIISLDIEAGEQLSSQTIIGDAARLIGEMAKGGFAG